MPGSATIQIAVDYSSATGTVAASAASTGAFFFTQQPKKVANGTVADGYGCAASITSLVNGVLSVPQLRPPRLRCALSCDTPPPVQAVAITVAPFFPTSGPDEGTVPPCAPIAGITTDAPKGSATPTNPVLKYSVPGGCKVQLSDARTGKAPMYRGDLEARVGVKYTDTTTQGYDQFWVGAPPSTWLCKLKEVIEAECVVTIVEETVPVQVDETMYP